MNIINKIHHEGNAKKVFEDISRFSKLENSERITKQGPLLIVCGGGQMGVFSGGGAMALEKLGLRNGFKMAVGISTGAPVVSYFLAGQAEVGTSIYFEENASKDSFIDFKNNLEGQSVMDIRKLYNLFSNGQKKLNIAALLENHTQVYYAVTNKLSAKGLLLNAKEIPDPIKGIEASCAVPELYNQDVIINLDGKDLRLVDGSVALPLPIKDSYSIHKPTSVLIFANRPKMRKETWLYRLIRAYAANIVEISIKNNIYKSDEVFNSELQFLKKSGVPYVIIWTDHTVTNLDKRANVLKTASTNFMNYVLSISKLQNKE